MCYFGHQTPQASFKLSHSLVTRLSHCFRNSCNLLISHLPPPTRGWRQLGAHSPAAQGTHWGMGEARTNGPVGDRTCDHPNFFFNKSFTFPGFAFPPLTFITCPTKNPNTCCFPSLNCATCPGFLLRTSSMTFASAPSSETCVNPFSCTICSGDFPLR